MNEIVTPAIRFDAYAFAPDTGELARNGRAIALRPQAAQVLRLLTSHAGRLVTREDLRAELWAAGTFVDFEHGLNLCIHEIRAALRDDASSPRYIETLPRRGYRFIARIAPSPFVPATIVPERAPTARASDPARRSRAIRPAIIVAFMCGAAATFAVSNQLQTRAAAPSPASITVPSVALLPLTELSGRDDEKYFAYRVSSELHRHLETVDSLRVTAFWSSVRYADSRWPRVEIAHELKASHLLSGSIMHHGDRARINLILIEPHSGRALWAESYDTALADLPAVETRAARAVGHALAGPQGSRPTSAIPGPIKRRDS